MKAADGAGREMTSAEQLDFETAMAAVNALAPKIAASEKVNTLSQFFNREGSCL